MPQINQNRIQQWIDALRSGEFQQGQNKLLDEFFAPDGTSIRKYCCLGVAQEVALSNGYQVDNMVTTRDLFYWGEDGMNDSMARDWFGFDSGDPVLIEEDEAGDPITCVRANDALGWSFDMIAEALQDRYITPGVPSGPATT